MHSRRKSRTTRLLWRSGCRWIAIPALLALAMLGCQGVGPGKSAAQNPGGGTLSVTTSIEVGNVVVGNSGTAIGTLAASGTSVIVSSATMGGTNSSEFSVSGLSFPVTITTSTPVSFTVTFTPGATGAATATASFASNASNSPSVSSLTGTGTPAPVHTVLLTWTPSTTTGITSYNVYRSLLSNGVCGSFGELPYASTVGSVTTYTDPTVTGGDTYCYGTTAVDANGESAVSNVVQAAIPVP